MPVTLDREATMERVIENNAKLNAFVLKALGMPQKTAIKKIIIITDEQEEAKPKNRIGKWAKVAQRIKELNIPSDVCEHVRASSKEFRENFHFKHDLVENNS